MSNPDGIVFGVDADPHALAAARERLARFGSRLITAEGYYDRLTEFVTAAGLRPVDGILFDVGVSSYQLEERTRGFSFQQNAPLDMRMGPSATRTAADLVNALPTSDLEQLFRTFGEERFARRIANRIVTERTHDPITTTLRLAEIVARAVPRTHTSRIHPATRVFQALRIAVNDELDRLSSALPQTVDLLQVGGRVAVITFHSLEDRIVKQFMRTASRDCICPPELPICQCGHRATLRLVYRKPVEATPAEVAANPRARSAKLRVAERLAS